MRLDEYLRWLERIMQIMSLWEKMDMPEVFQREEEVLPAVTEALQREEEVLPAVTEALQRGTEVRNNLRIWNESYYAGGGDKYKYCDSLTNNLTNNPMYYKEEWLEGITGGYRVNYFNSFVAPSFVGGSEYSTCVNESCFMDTALGDMHRIMPAVIISEGGNQTYEGELNQKELINFCFKETGREIQRFEKYEPCLRDKSEKNRLDTMAEKMSMGERSMRAIVNNREVISALSHRMDGIYRTDRSNAYREQLYAFAMEESLRTYSERNERNRQALTNYGSTNESREKMVYAFRDSGLAGTLVFNRENSSIEIQRKGNMYNNRYNSLFKVDDTYLKYGDDAIDYGDVAHMSKLITSSCYSNREGDRSVNINVDFTANATVSNSYDVEEFAGVFAQRLREELALCGEGIHLY